MQAHRVQKKVQFLLKLKKCECREIIFVRNHLIEHPIEAATPSFGFGTGGPIVSPMMRGKSDFYDRGLIHNVEAFDKFLSEVFEKARHKL